MRARISAKSKVKGSLLVRKRGNYQYFYHRCDEKDSDGTYISKRNISFARQLAQQDYEHKVLFATEKLEVVTAKCIALLEKCKFPDEIYDSLPLERKVLVSPVDSDDEFISSWLELHTYSPGYFDDDMPYYDTDGGDRVRSKTEQMMANMFHASGLIYVVEPVVKTKVKIRRPDFLVLNTRTRQEFYIEHMGMMDDPKYVEDNMNKIQEYDEIGICQGKNLILLFSDLKHPIDSKMIKRLIERILK